MKKKIAIIGAGFGGLSAAAYLSRDGYDVTVFEKNNQPGGRAIVYKSKGFTFDMGPSWYMMPDVFDDFFADFNTTSKKYYDIKKLVPSYRVYNATGYHDVKPVDEGGLGLFDDLEPGAADQIKSLLKKTSKEYSHIREHLLEKDYISPTDAIDSKALSMLANPALFRSYHSRIKNTTKNEDIQKILEFMTVFMGGSPQNIPGVYSLLSHVDLGLGIWYPMGGFGKVAKAFETIAKEQGATFVYNAEVEKIHTAQHKASHVEVNGELLEFDAIVANADYHHVETKLVPKNYQTYSERYWRKKTLSPSAMLVYLGVNKKVPGLLHHTMFFDSDWHGHFEQVFNKKEWSSRPLFYVSNPSKTDSSVAPKGTENIILLAPLANGLHPTEAQVDELVESLIARLESHTKTQISKDIVVKKIAMMDFFADTFNAYKGNAFGLAHTLGQSAMFRPRMQSRKLHNLFYVGQYTNPGTGVPMVILSGKIVARVVGERIHR
jgi:phytoene desaturase